MKGSRVRCDSCHRDVGWVTDPRASRDPKPYRPSPRLAVHHDLATRTRCAGSGTPADVAHAVGGRR